MEIQNSLSKLDPLKVQAAMIAKPAMSLKVTDDESQSKATVMLKDIKGCLNAIEDQRTNLVKPLNDWVKQVNSYAKEISTPLASSENHLKDQLKARAVELERIRAEEARKAEEERLRKEKEIREKAEAEKAANDFDSLLATPEAAAEKEAVREAALERETKAVQQEHQAQSKAIASIKVSGTRKVWKHEIVDVQLVPAEFLIVDEVAIRKAVLAGARNIPGVRIFEDVVISAGR